MRPAMLLILIVSLVSIGGSLWGEAMDFLDILVSQGYRVGSITALEVSYLEPCTLQTCSGFLTGKPGGYLIAMGGNHILDLELELQGPGWSIIDTLPDDFPVLEVDSIQVATASRILLLARDMTHCSLNDSVVVMWALLPVDRDQ
jgi:hypothetical protein